MPSQVEAMTFLCTELALSHSGLFYPLECFSLCVANKANKYYPSLAFIWCPRGHSPVPARMSEDPGSEAGKSQSFSLRSMSRKKKKNKNERLVSLGVGQRMVSPILPPKQVMAECINGLV